MSWTNAVVTDAGQALQASLAGTGKGFSFTRAASGAGVAAGDLAAQTALTDERQALSLQPAQTLAGAKIRLQAVLSNNGLQTGYTMHQLGIFAKAEDSETEVLYAIAQDETGDAIPAAASAPGFSVDWTYIVGYGNAGQVTVTLDPAGVVDFGSVGQPGGVAGLDENGKVPGTQLPAMDYAPSEHTHAADDIVSGVLALARGGTGAGTAQGARANLEVAKPVRAEVSFPTSGWTLSGSVYTQTVTCAAAAGTMAYANIGPKYSTDADARALEQEAYALIAYIDTADGQLIATCWGDEKPAVNLTLIFEGGAD